MRTLILAGLTMVTAFGANAADAQRIGPGAPYPMPGAGGAPMQAPPPPMMNPPVPPRPAMPPQANGGRPYPGPQMQNRGGRWGGSTGGRWSGGTSAPGGWNAYRRPSRGRHMPNYWSSPDFYLGDYGSYGLWAPPAGTSWYRYYDDAVLVDGRGRVVDSRGGIDWDGGYGYDAGYRGGYDGGYAGGGYGPHPLPPVERRGNVTTYSTGGAYYAGGYYYPGATTTVVTIEAAPSVTTTTTEYIETERTRYVAPRRVYHAPARVWRPTCSCKRVAPRVVRRHVEKPIQGS